MLNFNCCRVLRNFNYFFLSYFFFGLFFQNSSVWYFFASSHWLRQSRQNDLRHFVSQMSKAHIKKFASFYGFGDNQNASARSHISLPFVISHLVAVAARHTVRPLFETFTYRRFLSCDCVCVSIYAFYASWSDNGNFTIIRSGTHSKSNRKTESDKDTHTMWERRVRALVARLWQYFQLKRRQIFCVWHNCSFLSARCLAVAVDADLRHHSNIYLFQ